MKTKERPKRGGEGREQEGQSDVKRRGTTNQPNLNAANKPARGHGGRGWGTRSRGGILPWSSRELPRPPSPPVHPQVTAEVWIRKPLGCTLVADKTGVPSALLKRRIRLGLKPAPRTPARRGGKVGGKDDEITCSGLHGTCEKEKRAVQKSKTTRAMQKRKKGDTAEKKRSQERGGQLGPHWQEQI